MKIDFFVPSRQCVISYCKIHVHLSQYARSLYTNTLNYRREVIEAKEQLKLSYNKSLTFTIDLLCKILFVRKIAIECKHTYDFNKNNNMKSYNF